MRQIVQMGQALARMLARLLNIKQIPDGGLSLEEIRQVYGDELDLSLEMVLNTPGDELINILTADLKLIDQHLEKMVDILVETAGLLERTGDAKSATELRAKGIILLEHLQASSGIYSMERVNRIADLKEML